MISKSENTTLSKQQMQKIHPLAFPNFLSYSLGKYYFIIQLIKLPINCIYDSHFCYLEYLRNLLFRKLCNKAIEKDVNNFIQAKFITLIFCAHLYFSSVPTFLFIFLSFESIQEMFNQNTISSCINLTATISI